MAKKKVTSKYSYLTSDWKSDDTVTYTYDNRRDCETHGCRDEGICRCGHIENIHITAFDTSYLIWKVLGTESNHNIADYCVDRLIRIAFRKGAPSPWDLSDLINIETCRGYYGEEIDSVKLDDSLAKELIKKLNHLDSLKTEKEKLAYLLTEDYGFLLPELTEISNWEIVYINGKKLNIGNYNHFKSLDPKKVAQYKDYDFPRAICLADGGKYRLIDGYHRIAAQLAKGTEEQFPVIVGSK